MANPHKGEVSLTISGTAYVLKMSTNALCVAEKVTGETPAEMMESLARSSILTRRALFMAALAHQLPDMTVERAGDLMDEAGPSTAREALEEAMLIAFPAPKGTDENPTMPERAGTGTDSTRTG